MAVCQVGVVFGRAGNEGRGKYRGKRNENSHDETVKYFCTASAALRGIFQSCTASSGIVGNEGTRGSCGSACSMCVSSLALSSFPSTMLRCESFTVCSPRSHVATASPVTLICNYYHTHVYLSSGLLIRPPFPSQPQSCAFLSSASGTRPHIPRFSSSCSCSSPSRPATRYTRRSRPARSRSSSSLAGFTCSRV